MFFDCIDLQRLRRDVASASRQCTDLKRTLRRTWARPMADEQQALARAARRVTELCILRARTRGRWHVTVAPREVRDAGGAWDRDTYHARIAERVARDYAAAPGEAKPAILEAPSS